MKTKKKITLFSACALLISFVIFTLLVRYVDVGAIGPCESLVGFARFNGFVHRLIGVNMTLYRVTDWLGLVPIAVAFAYAILGLVQWIKRHSIKRVDKRIIVLGGFYIAVILVYLFFENVSINHRPVLIDGYLETSYPSSTTLLVTTVMPSAMIELNARIKARTLRHLTLLLIGLFTAFMVIARLVSGVHWASDIIGGAIVSAALVLSYYSLYE